MQLNSLKSFTLLELIVTSILATIIMLGLVSVEYGARQSEQTISKSSLLAMRVTAMMIPLSKDAAIATGNANDSGFKGTNVAPLNSLNIRQDINSTPDNLGDDNWICYTRLASSELRRCIKPNRTDQCSAVEGTQVGFLNQITGTVVQDTAAQDFYLEVTLTSRYDPSSADTSNLTNPQYSLTSRITPRYHTY